MAEHDCVLKKAVEQMDKGVYYNASEARLGGIEVGLGCYDCQSGSHGLARVYGSAGSISYAFSNAPEACQPGLEESLKRVVGAIEQKAQEIEGMMSE